MINGWWERLFGDKCNVPGDFANPFWRTALTKLVELIAFIAATVFNDGVEDVQGIVQVGYIEELLTTVGNPIGEYDGIANACVFGGTPFKGRVHGPSGHVGLDWDNKLVVLGTDEFIAAASSFSRLRHLALLFWNQT